MSRGPRGTIDHAQQHRHAILVVDDDDAVRDALGTLLDVEGYEVQTARLGLDALTMIALGSRPCLILLDIRMPEMDGWDVWTTLQAQPKFADIPVVVLSGDSGVVLAHHEGIAGMLAKPVDRDELVATITTHARCWPSPVGR